MKSHETRQQLIVCNEHDIHHLINTYLAKGWKVVPGTIVLQSVEQVRPSLSNDRATPTNTIFKTKVAIVIQWDDKAEEQQDAGGVASKSPRTGGDNDAIAPRLE